MATNSVHFLKLFFCYLTFSHLISLNDIVNAISSPDEDVERSDFSDNGPVLADTQAEGQSSIIQPMRVTNNSVAQLAELMTTNQDFIFLKLHFANIVWEDPYMAYFNEEDFLTFIDPLTFSFVRPGYGYLLMSLPFDLMASSLRSLGFAVSSIELTIQLKYPTVFLELSDVEQLDTVFQLLELAVREADLMNELRNRVEEFAICLEHLDNYKGVRAYLQSAASGLISNRYPLLQSVSECRVHNAVDDSQGPPERYWFTQQLPLMFSFFFAMFAPLTLSLFLRMDPPPYRDERGILRMPLTLPIGFNNLLLSSYSNNRILKGGKVLIGISILIFLSYSQPTIAYLANQDDVIHRVFAMERADLTSYWVFLGTLTSYQVVFLVMFVAYFVRIVLSNRTGACWESDETRRCLTGWQLPKELWVPASPETLPFTQTVLYYAKYRMLMSLDIRLWKHEYHRLWKWIASYGECQSLCKYTFDTMMFLLLLSPYTILLLLRLVFNSLPVFYITKQCFWYMSNIPFGAMFIVIGSLRLPAIVWYLITIFQCIFTGFVINHEVVIPCFIISTAIAVFSLNTLTRVHNEYTSLVKEITHEVNCLHNWKKQTAPIKHRDRDYLQKRLPTDSLPVACEPDEAIKEIEIDPVKEGYQFPITNEGTLIDMNLYHFVMNEMHNIQQRFTCTLLTLLLASTIVAIAFQYLWVIDRMVALGPLMYPLSAAMLALALPLVYRLISMDARYQPMRAQNRGAIRNLIHEYCQREGYETTQTKTQDDSSQRINVEDNAGFVNEENIELNDIYYQLPYASIE